MPSSGGRDGDTLQRDGAPVTPPEPWRVGPTRSIRWLLSPSPAVWGVPRQLWRPLALEWATGHTQVYLYGDVPTASYCQLHSFHLRGDGPMG